MFKTVSHFQRLVEKSEIYGDDEMIRKYADSDIDAVMQIWLITNIQAHSFISVRSTLRLNVYQKNKRAIQFYLREEFSIESESLDGNTGEKELVMVWNR